MKKVIIYFHGFNSSPKTDKVDRLKMAFPDDYVYAFPINIDPDVAKLELETAIDSCLLDHLNENVSVIFVGTSLGAWWANKMGELYDCPTIIINPCEDPANSLRKYGIDEHILSKFEPIVFHPEKDFYFIALRDEVITPSITWIFQPDVFLYDSPEVKHQFNGPEFDDVIDLIKTRFG